MKRMLLLLAIFCLINPAFSDEWDDFSGLDRAWDGQKPITNQEFEKAIDTLQQKQTKKEAKARKKLIKKIGGGGTSLHNELNPDKDITEITPLNKKHDGQLLNIPVNIIINETSLDKGFYNVFGEKEKNGEIYLSFYQSQFFKGKVKAIETNDDFESDEIDFVQLIPYDNNFIKIIFGSLDFNAYTYIRYQNEN